MTMSHEEKEQAIFEHYLEMTAVENLGITQEEFEGKVVSGEKAKDGFNRDFIM